MKTTFKYSLEGQETDRLLFRRITEQDFDTWLAFCKYPDSLKYIFSQEQLKVEDPIERCNIWFKRVFNRYENELGGMNALIDKQTGELVGQCGLLIQTIDDIEELEIGYSLMPAHRGKGYASEAAIKCKEFAFENEYATSLISVIVPENSASIKVAMNNGMKLDKTTTSNGDIVNIYRINKP
ncbi:MAG: GNAT family N-acetyltransferase [Bacteroidia bacterium]